MSAIILGRAHVLGDEINTDLHCSSKYLPGRDTAYIAERAFEQVAPGFASRFSRGDVIVAGRNFGINSSREQAVHVMRLMGVAVIVAVSVMLAAATPLANFIAKNPTIVMLALGFLLMIGMTLIADGMGFHVPKGYVYAAMGFSALVEGLNMLARRKRVRARAARMRARTEGGRP